MCLYSLRKRKLLALSGPTVPFRSRTHMLCHRRRGLSAQGGVTMPKLLPERVCTQPKGCSAWCNSWLRFCTKPSSNHPHRPAMIALLTMTAISVRKICGPRCALANPARCSISCSASVQPLSGPQANASPSLAVVARLGSATDRIHRIGIGIRIMQK